MRRAPFILLSLAGLVLSVVAWHPRYSRADAGNDFNAPTILGKRGFSKTDPTNGQLLKYDGTTKLWTPATVAGAALANPVTATQGGTGIDTHSSTGVPIVTAGTWTIPSILAIAQGGTGAATAAANKVFAGPTTGADAAPSFRSLVGNDLPSFSGDVANTGAAMTVGALQGRTVSNASPSTGYPLKWDGSQWAPGLLGIAGGGTGITSSPSGAGLFLRASGAGAWAVSGLVLPNAATSAYLLQATSTDTIGAVALSGDATIAAGGALTLKNSGVTAGTYYQPAITFDAQGRATSAASQQGLFYSVPLPLLSAPTTTIVTNGDGAFHAMTSAIQFPQVTGSYFLTGRFLQGGNAIAGKALPFDITGPLGVSSVPGSTGTSAANSYTNMVFRAVPVVTPTGSSQSNGVITVAVTMTATNTNFTVPSSDALAIQVSTTSVASDTFTVGYIDGGISGHKLLLVGGYSYIGN